MVVAKLTIALHVWMCPMEAFFNREEVCLIPYPLQSVIEAGSKTHVTPFVDLCCNGI